MNNARTFIIHSDGLLVLDGQLLIVLRIHVLKSGVLHASKKRLIVPLN
jgi:hypothetical protein